LAIYGPVQIHPLPPDLDEGLVHPPAPAHRLLETLPAFFTRFGVAHDPSQDRRMGNRHPTLGQHLNEIAIAKLEAKIPAKAEKDDLVVEPTPGEERVALTLAVCHVSFSLKPSPSAPEPREVQTLHFSKGFIRSLDCP